MSHEPNQFDTPWKNILEGYFQDFLAFFLPEAHDGIDWQRDYEFLDKELARITRKAAIGDRRMDKLVKVWQLDGVEQWVLIHIEIQGNRETDFAARMFTYHYRAYDLHQKPVVGLAILADKERSWRPSEFGHSLWGMQLLYRFNMVKLLDYMDQTSILETSGNPFAIVTLAHLHAKRTKHHPEDRFQAKWQIIRSLYQRGFTSQKIIDLFRFIDWVLTLSKEADQQFWQELTHFEECQKMPYLCSVERIGMEKGEKKGIEIGVKKGIEIGEKRGIEIGEKKGIEIGEKRASKRDVKKGAARIFLRMIEQRFGPVPDWVHDKVSHANINTIESWTAKILEANQIEAIFQ